MNKILILCCFTVIIITYFLFSHQLIEKFVLFGNTGFSGIDSAKINYKIGKITLPENLKCSKLTKEQKALTGLFCIKQQRGYKYIINNKDANIPLLEAIEKVTFNIDINNIDYYDYDKLKIVKEWFDNYPSGTITIEPKNKKTIQIPFSGIVNFKTGLLPENSFQILSL